MNKIVYENITYSDIVELLVEQKIVSIFQGNVEAGPRALGNRSILFDPRDRNAVFFVNNVKKREVWRPFAASVLEEHAHEWFEMLSIERSSYMMYAIPAKEDKKKLIQGVLHIDGTSRIQTVNQEENLHYYNLIMEFYKKTSIPMLFNTSFNLSGEVICYTIEDALSTLERSEIEYLYLPEKNQLIYVPNNK